MALEDIEKLKERLANNPDSKLFVPLAEEYRKAEMFDEAIEVLKQGLENQPSYMSARVSLGKIYLEKEMFDEALSEFEEVIKTIPDNLFAHKKLAEIYKDRGLNSKARERYETVLRLSPLDDDAQMNLEALEGLPDDIQEEVSAPPAKETVHETEAIEEPAPPAQERPRTEENMEDILREEVSYTDSEEGFYEDELLGEEVPPADMELSGDDFDAFKNAMEADRKPDVVKDDMARPVAESKEPAMYYGGDQSPVEEERQIMKDARGSILPDSIKTGQESLKEKTTPPPEMEFIPEETKAEAAARPPLEPEVPHMPRAEPEPIKMEPLSREPAGEEIVAVPEEENTTRPPEMEVISEEIKAEAAAFPQWEEPSHVPDVVHEPIPASPAPPEPHADAAPEPPREEIVLPIPPVETPPVESVESDARTHPSSAGPITGPAGEIKRIEDLVAQERFYDAIKQYNDLVQQFPEDKRILQKLQELKAYIKMVGKDREAVVNKLEMLLSGIVRRKNEFQRGS